MPSKQVVVSKPTYAVMVTESIKALGNRSGSSVPAISKQLVDRYKIDVNKHALSKAIKKGVEAGDLVQIKASYKLGKKSPVKKASVSTTPTTTTPVPKKKTTKTTSKTAPPSKSAKAAAPIKKASVPSKPRKSITKKSKPSKKSATASTKKSSTTSKRAAPTKKATTSKRKATKK